MEGKEDTMVEIKKHSYQILRKPVLIYTFTGMLTHNKVIFHTRHISLHELKKTQCLKTCYYDKIPS
jgi:hypothetical protein